VKKFICILFCLMITLNLLNAQKWIFQHIPNSPDLHDIEVLSDSMSYVYTYGTGEIFKTIDEGRSWEKISTLDSIYFEQIQFISDNIAFLCGEKGRIYQTTSGGKDWNDISIKNSGSNILLYGMWFKNEKEGMVTGGEMTTNKIINKNYFTDDGGNTWQEKPSPTFIYSIEQDKNNQFWATGNGKILRMNEDRTWIILYNDTSKKIGQIRAIDFDNNNVAAAVSFNGYALRSTDNGDTWDIQKITENRLRDVVCFGQDCWITAGDLNKTDTIANILISTDSGKTWNESEKMQDIHRIGLSHSYIWIVGKNGLIAKKGK